MNFIFTLQNCDKILLYPTRATFNQNMTLLFFYKVEQLSNCRHMKHSKMGRVEYFIRKKQIQVYFSKVTMSKLWWLCWVIASSQIKNIPNVRHAFIFFLKWGSNSISGYIHKEVQTGIQTDAGILMFTVASLC